MLDKAVEQAKIDAAVKAQKEVVDAHVRETMDWHFSDASGCEFWLGQRKSLDFNPIKDVKGLDDLVRLFPLFDGKLLKTVPADMWIPRGFRDCKSHAMFITGGTSGTPSRRWGRISDDPEGSDYSRDYSALSRLLSKKGFPEGGTCLFLGPQGSRRLKRGIAILAAIRGNLFFEVDMDVAWMKNANNTAKKAYKDQLVHDAIAAIRRDNPKWVFCPPILIQAIGEVFDWSKSSVKGILAGGTEMTPQTVRFIMEEHLGPDIDFVPIFGNALVGLAPSRTLATPENPIDGQESYSVIYQPMEPYTILRVTKPGNPRELAACGERGPLTITTLSKESYLSISVERDLGGQTAPTIQYPSYGICEIGPSDEDRKTLSTGVY